MRVLRKQRDFSPAAVNRKFLRIKLISMALARGIWSQAFAFKPASRMGRRPLDRRSFRDECVAERSQMWRPENVPQDIPFGDLIVGWLVYFSVACM